MSSRRFNILGGLFLAGCILLIYSSSLSTGFFADDYNFLEPAARLDAPAYLSYYFDPRAQILWYRPLQGVQILIEWWLFGANAAGYHIVQILIHLVNGLLLWAIVARVSKQSRLGFLAALFYATFPVYALAINWINITDPAMTVFYLGGVWFWVNYLEEKRRRDYAWTIALFILALLFKQMALTLPAILFLLDILIINPTDARALPRETINWLRRYLAFGVVVIAFFGVQSIARSTGTFASVFGYTVGLHIVSIIVQYLSLLAFPWGYYPPSDTQIVEQLPEFVPLALVGWMLVAMTIYVMLFIKTRSRALLFLGLGCFVTLLPVLPFPFVELRYLYLPAIFSGIALALLVEQTRAFALSRSRVLSRSFALFAALALGLLVVGDAFAVADANAGIFEIARQRRVPFRDISRAHPTFPNDTHLYFIDPVSPITELSGMFTLRYGRGVTVGGNQRGIANLRAHNAAYVYYFDETGKPIEIAISRDDPTRASLALPAKLNAPIQLDGYEIARATVRRGEMFVLLVYWRAVGDIGKDYTVFAHLLDKNGKQVAGYDSQPRRGEAPTSHWKLQSLTVDPILFLIPYDAAIGEYRLEIGMYDLATLERLTFVDAQGQPATDKVVIEPIRVQ